MVLLCRGAMFAIFTFVFIILEAGYGAQSPGAMTLRYNGLIL